MAVRTVIRRRMLAGDWHWNEGTAVELCPRLVHNADTAVPYSAADF